MEGRPGPLGAGVERRSGRRERGSRLPWRSAWTPFPGSARSGRRVRSLGAVPRSRRLGLGASASALGAARPGRRAARPGRELGAVGDGLGAAVGGRRARGEIDAPSAEDESSERARSKLRASKIKAPSGQDRSAARERLKRARSEIHLGARDFAIF